MKFHDAGKFSRTQTFPNMEVHCVGKEGKQLS
jgi:hypothetical protein